jgi:hypothetical protein
MLQFLKLFSASTPSFTSVHRNEHSFYSFYKSILKEPPTVELA